MKKEKLVFVFPLKDVILYPHSRLPLHIFEPRYLQMVKDSIDEGVDIAITLPPQGKGAKTPHRFEGVLAGAGRPHILKQHSDGRMIILLVGREKVKLGGIVEDEPYIVCEAEVILESSEFSNSNRFRLNRIHQDLERWATENIEDTQTYHQFMESLNTPTNIIETAALIFLSQREKQQQLLELNDINQKLETLIQLLEEPEAEAKS